MSSSLVTQLIEVFFNDLNDRSGFDTGECDDEIIAEWQVELATKIQSVVQFTEQENAQLKQQLDEARAMVAWCINFLELIEELSNKYASGIVPLEAITDICKRNNRGSLKTASQAFIADVQRKAVKQFAQSILHGDEKHQAWLLEAAEKFGQPENESGVSDV